MGWKAIELEEYESSAPAVQAHFHAVRAEEALRKDDYGQAEKEGHLASKKFLEAAQRVSDKRTIDALVMLAENYEYRAKVARARNPDPVEMRAETKEVTTREMCPDRLARLRYAACQETVQTTSGDLGDPEEGHKVETQLHVAAAEMEELWRRLNEIGLSCPGSADKNLLMSSRHLSSSLGDSFCLLPAKTRSTIGVVATAVNGGSTLRAAVASRMRNQRQRLMEQQLGGRGPSDPRRSGDAPMSGNGLASYVKEDKERSVGSGNESACRQEELDGLQDKVAHQKMEIARLLNTVKTLSSENSKLVNKCEALTNIQAENREIRESMDRFKKDYNQKLVMIKRALEEWRRQRNCAVQTSPQPMSAGGVDSVLSDKVKAQEEQITKLMQEMKEKDDRIAKYDKWYQTLKAGAKAKQLSQSRESSNEASSFSSSNSFVQSGGGSLSGPSSSPYTSGSNFRGLSPGSSELAGSSSSSALHQFSRPPAHPNRRAL
ncbi:unnamed protein product [Hyaloperonospora brassicae]|uniref:Uncharacterized protein n=1 Tax=Hyaloperonospora brassicae TaxID=162125 RepID=A0AAV0UA98_HYABA|nr:unnamed protein product [Hyaloperonospora brassicae]